MEKAVKALFSIMPLLFGLGFIAPLIAQSMARLDWPAPFGLSQLAFGLAIGGIWGLYANIKGRWV